jgi:adenylate cyclase
VERKLAAILCADVYGYSRLMGEDEEATLRTLTSHRKLIDSQIKNHHGRFVNSAGDSVLAEFASVVEAVNCAVDIQTGLKAENASVQTERRMEFRIGVNLGDVMVEGDQIHGDGVNVAARLESLAEPGGICISRTVHENVKNKLPLNFEDLGEQAVKNIADPIRIYRVLMNGAVAAPRATRPARGYWRGGMLSLTGLAIIVVTVVLVRHLSLKPPHTSASIPPRDKPALSLPNIPSIAVLPFINAGGDPQQEYFSDGMSDQVINGLSRIPNLFVIARNSSFAYKGKTTKEREIGKELGVNFVLEGSVRKSADHVRVGVELVDASTGAEKWTARYDRPTTDIFAVQDEIVDKVVTTLSLLFKLDELKLPHPGAVKPTTNLEAFDDYLRAIEYSSRMTKGDNARARQWAENAVKEDPKFAAAYALLGTCYWNDVVFGWSENSGMDLRRSSELAQQALALDDSNVSALVLASRLDYLQKRFEDAVAEARRATGIDPNYAGGYVALAEALNVAGYPDDAIRAAEKAMRLDPSGQEAYSYEIGLAYVLLERYQAAITVFKKHLAAYPNSLYAHLDLVIAYTELGRDQNARAEAAEVMRISPQYVVPTPENGLLKDVALNKRYESDQHRAGHK